MKRNEVNYFLPYGKQIEASNVLSNMPERLMPNPADAPSPTELTQTAVEWLVRLRDGDLSEEETHAFADWLSQGVEYTDAFAKAERLFDEMIAVEMQLHTAGLPSEHQNAAPKLALAKRPLRKIKPWLAIPLGLATAWLVAVGLVLPRHASLLDSLISDYYTQTGEIRAITLADGSQLLLNTNTAVSVEFRPAQRLIILLHGQVKFTVAKDSARPFEVKTDNLRVTALGTVFDIYRKTRDDITVMVQEHAVTARIEETGNTNQSKQSAPVTIEEGQLLHYQSDGKLLPPTPVNLAQAAAWQHRHLSIKDRPLSTLVEELNRYRLGRIYLAGDSLKNLRVTGVFPLDNPDAALASIRNVLGLQLTRLGPWWVVLHR
jgi:transmembrane sensor